MIFGYLIIFLLFSFIGGVLDYTYRFFITGKIINKFRLNAFSPVYGFGTLFVIFLLSVFPNISLPFRIMIYFLSLSAIEYISALICEKIIGKKFWDYSNRRFNIHGRVCLFYSLIWTFLALVFDLFLYKNTMVMIANFSFVPFYVNVISVLFTSVLLSSFMFILKTKHVELKRE